MRVCERESVKKRERERKREGREEKGEEAHTHYDAMDVDDMKRILLYIQMK